MLHELFACPPIKKASEVCAAAAFALNCVQAQIMYGGCSTQRGAYGAYNTDRPLD